MYAWSSCSSAPGWQFDEYHETPVELHSRPLIKVQPRNDSYRSRQLENSPTEDLREQERGGMTGREGEGCVKENQYTMISVLIWYNKVRIKQETANVSIVYTQSAPKLLGPLVDIYNNNNNDNKLCIIVLLLLLL